MNATKGTTYLLLTISLAAAIVVPQAHGGINGSAIWNLLPLPVALLPLLIMNPLKEIRYAIYLFSYTIVSIVLLVHLGYLIDIGRMLSASAPAGKKVFGLPLYSIAAGYIAAMIGVAIGEIRGALLLRRTNGE